MKNKHIIVVGLIAIFLAGCALNKRTTYSCKNGLIREAKTFRYKYQMKSKIKVYNSSGIIEKSTLIENTRTTYITLIKSVVIKYDTITHRRIGRIVKKGSKN